MSTLLKYSKLWKHSNIETYLTQQISINGQVLIYEACRRDYVDQVILFLKKITKPTAR